MMHHQHRQNSLGGAHNNPYDAPLQKRESKRTSLLNAKLPALGKPPPVAVKQPHQPLTGRTHHHSFRGGTDGPAAAHVHHPELTPRANMVLKPLQDAKAVDHAATKEKRKPRKKAPEAPLLAEDPTGYATMNVADFECSEEAFPAGDEAKVVKRRKTKKGTSRVVTASDRTEVPVPHAAAWVDIQGVGDDLSSEMGFVPVRRSHRHRDSKESTSTKIAVLSVGEQTIESEYNISSCPSLESTSLRGSIRASLIRLQRKHPNRFRRAGRVILHALQRVVANKKRRASFRR